MKVNFKHQTLIGIVWNFIQQVGNYGIKFLVFLLLARLLNSKDFGVIAIATSLIMLVETFYDHGISQAIIQYNELNDENLNICFWVTFITSVLLYVILFFCSKFIAIIFNQSILTNVIRILSLSFIVSALSKTQQSILLRNLNYKKLTVSNLFGNIIGGIVGVTMAYLNYGLWSLVLMMIISRIVNTIIYWLYVDWYPSFKFDYYSYKDVNIFGYNTIKIKFLNYLDHNADNFIIGYFLGANILGYYNIAYKLTKTFNDICTGVINNVMFPSFARIQKDKLKVRKWFDYIIKILLIVILPLSAYLVFVTPEFLSLLFGDKWLPVTNIARILIIATSILSAIQSIESINWGLGNIHDILKIRFIVTLGLVLGITIGAQFNLFAVVISILSVNFLMFVPLYINLAQKNIGINKMVLYKNIIKNIILSIVPLIIMFVINNMYHIINKLLFIIAYFLIYLLIYSTIYLATDKEDIKYIFITIKKTMYDKN